MTDMEIGNLYKKINLLEQEIESLQAELAEYKQKEEQGQYYSLDSIAKIRAKLVRLKEYEQADSKGLSIKLPEPDVKIDEMSVKEVISRISEHNNLHFSKEYPRAQHITQALNIAVKALAELTEYKAIGEPAELVKVVRCKDCIRRSKKYCPVYKKNLVGVKVSIFNRLGYCCMGVSKEDNND